MNQGLNNLADPIGDMLKQLTRINLETKATKLLIDFFILKKGVGIYGFVRDKYYIPFNSEMLATLISQDGMIPVADSFYNKIYLFIQDGDRLLDPFPMNGLKEMNQYIIIPIDTKFIQDMVKGESINIFLDSEKRSVLCYLDTK